MAKQYSLEDVTRSFGWLGHKGFTELNAYHQEYRPGRENFHWNLEHNTFPRIWYVRGGQEVVRFVQRYHGSWTLCYGLNERGTILKGSRGYPRSAREDEIEVSQNCLFDIDFESKHMADSQMVPFERFFQKAEEYFRDQGFKSPVRAQTGKGWHLDFAYPQIRVVDCPDIAERLGHFRNQFYSAYGKELERLEARLDKTQDLRRMVKIYGTAKPRIGVISRFYGNERVEDEALRDYLLGMKVRGLAEHGVREAALLCLDGQLPEWFQGLVGKDGSVRELWAGTGKPGGSDTTGSGYDFSLAKRLLRLGYKNIDELATILALRPDGSVRKSGKGEYYIRRTIAKALVR